MGKLLTLVFFLFLVWLAVRFGRFATRLLVFAASLLLLIAALYFVFVR
jgi:hypothetical protein